MSSVPVAKVVGGDTPQALVVDRALPEAREARLPVAKEAPTQSWGEWMTGVAVHGLVKAGLAADDLYHAVTGGHLIGTAQDMSASSVRVAKPSAPVAVTASPLARRLALLLGALRVIAAQDTTLPASTAEDTSAAAPTGTASAVNASNTSTVATGATSAPETVDANATGLPGTGTTSAADAENVSTVATRVPSTPGTVDAGTAASTGTSTAANASASATGQPSTPGTADELSPDECREARTVVQAHSGEGLEDVVKLIAELLGDESHQDLVGALFNMTDIPQDTWENYFTPTNLDYYLGVYDDAVPGTIDTLQAALDACFTTTTLRQLYTTLLSTVATAQSGATDAPTSVRGATSTAASATNTTVLGLAQQCLDLFDQLGYDPDTGLFNDTEVLGVASGNGTTSSAGDFNFTTMGATTPNSLFQQCLDFVGIDPATAQAVISTIATLTTTTSSTSTGTSSPTLGLDTTTHAAAPSGAPSGTTSSTEFNGPDYSQGQWVNASDACSVAQCPDGVWSWPQIVTAGGLGALALGFGIYAAVRLAKHCKRNNNHQVVDINAKPAWMDFTGAVPARAEDYRAGEAWCKTEGEKLEARDAQRQRAADEAKAEDDANAQALAQLMQQLVPLLQQAAALRGGNDAVRNALGGDRGAAGPRQRRRPAQQQQQRFQQM